MRRLGDALLLGALVAVLIAAAVVVRHHPSGGTSLIAPAATGLVAANPATAQSSSPTPTSSSASAPASSGAGLVTTIATGDQITAGDGSWYALAVKGDPKLSSVGNVAAADSTTHDLLASFSHDVLAKHPQLVVIMAGSADVAQKVSLSTVAANLRMMIKAATDAGAKVALCTVPPRNAVPVYPLNDQLRAVAKDTGVILLDLHDAVSTSAGVWVPADTGDGVIPNATGAQKIAQAADAQLAKAGF
ncbi:MAG TPA: GDSL-type esterase/lipase family protein [Mycobacteriales bacterium]|jgi:lysophospholipase L1-like esterase|nr:GDSL-type esterase/lipase family protein [Mycobacteriales bacterium]